MDAHMLYRCSCGEPSVRFGPYGNVCQSCWTLLGAEVVTLHSHRNGLARRAILFRDQQHIVFQLSLKTRMWERVEAE
jgi:hypothetical protein